MTILDNDPRTLATDARDLNSGQLRAGDTVRYAITVTNQSITVGGSGVTVTDSLPAEVTMVAAAPAGYTGPDGEEGLVSYRSQ